MISPIDLERLIGNMFTLLRADFLQEIKLSSNNGIASLGKDRRILDIIPIIMITS
jgi:hypothetical protein